MKVYACKGFDGHYPVGTSAVIVANDEEDAKTLLESKLLSMGLPQDREPDRIEEIDLRWSQVIILNDGNY